MAASLRVLVTADTPEGMGLCCVHGFLALQDIRMKAKPEGRLMPAMLTSLTGFTIAASNVTLSKWRKGLITCGKCKNCILVKTGLKDEPLPQWSPEHMAFRSLKGKSFLVDRVETILKPIGPEPIRGRIVGMSQTDWLWVGVTLEYSPITVKLGDQLRLDDEIWGTVVSIDGPVFYILLPGSFHHQRQHRLKMGGVEPSHVKPIPGLDKT